MALVPSTFHKEYTLDCKKWGDVEKEKQLEERMKQLGLYDYKTNIESQLIRRLSSAIDEDSIVGAIKKSAQRRRRPLSERVQSVVSGIKNVIRQNVVRDSEGRKASYQVDILMGHFTKDVTHQVCDKQVLVTGCTPNGTRLIKEIRIEFPYNVDMTKLDVSYSAGVFKMAVPFTKTGSQGQTWGSSNSEDTMSCTSETDSDVFAMSLTPEPD